MNNSLLEQIVRHIFSNLGVIPDQSYHNIRSLMSKEFLLKDKIQLELDNNIIRNDIWGCQISADEQELKIIVGDCSQDRKIPEFSLIVQLKNSPTYGVYLVYNDLVNYSVDSEPMIACSLNQKDWMTCNTYLQATFLAGMEQTKDIGLSWSKCLDYQSQYKLMLSFIKFHHNFFSNFGEEDAG